ncbi:hypothetical protein D9613_011774 [Agrocybe pediades]|uniref:DUF6534 domain-containing protein n=1 Tax=Agrocybe pediades TaxID=84607 RepID=A0A8H4QKA9_9AGAR|nr:hypothetical protein D9613_011774 [Agrocybe pediades]
MIQPNEGTSVTQAPLPTFDLTSTLGALLIGVLVSCFLFGIIAIQAFTFYTRFPHDKPSLKLIVLVLCLCEVGHISCTLPGTYLEIVSTYGNPKGLIRLPPVTSISIGFNAIISPLVQIFYANRVRIVGGQLYVPILCSACSLARSFLTFVALFKALRTPVLAETVVEIREILPALLGVGAAVDVILTATLAYYIAKRKRSAILLDTTLLWTVQTGFASFICGIAMLVAFLTMPDNFVWIGIEAVLGRTFTCALLASLNGRTKTLDRSMNVVELRSMNGDRNTRGRGESFVDTTDISEDKVKSHESPCHDAGYDAEETDSTKGAQHLQP